MSDASHVTAIARVEFRRMLRKYHGSGRGLGKLVSLIVSALLLAAVGGLGGYAAYHVGRGIATSDPDGIAGPDGIALLGGVLALFAVISAVVFLVRGVGARGTLDQPEGTLTVVPTIEAYLGQVLAEYSFYLLWVLGPAIGIGAGFGLGVGTPTTALTLPVAAAGVGVVGVGLGYPTGVGLRHVFTRFPFVARNKGAILVVVFGAYFAVVMTGTLNDLVASLFEPLQASPLAWFAHLALLGVPAFPASAPLAAGALALALAIGAVAAIGGTWIADHHWFADPTLAGEETDTAPTETPDRGIERHLEGVLGRQTGALVALAWRRAVRSPLKLLYAMYPTFFLAGAFADIVQTGEIPAYLPFMLVFIVTWAAGVVFTLNPLGDQGAALSASLLSRVTGRTFVHAHLIAALVVAVPLAVVLTAVVGLLSPVETTTVAGLVAVTPVLMIVSAALSIGIGMAFPKFEATNVTRSMKTVLPSTVAFALFSAHLVLTGAAGAIVYDEGIRTVAAAFISFVIPFGVSVAPGTLYWIAAAALVPLVLAPIPAYRFAVRRFDRYTIA